MNLNSEPEENEAIFKHEQSQQNSKNDYKMLEEEKQDETIKVIKNCKQKKHWPLNVHVYLPEVEEPINIDI